MSRRSNKKGILGSLNFLFNNISSKIKLESKVPKSKVRIMRKRLVDEIKVRDRKILELEVEKRALIRAMYNQEKRTLEQQHSIKKMMGYDSKKNP